MRINKGLQIYVRLIVVGLVAFFGVLTIIASGGNSVWVKPGSTQQDFSQDKYTCLQESQQKSSSAYVNRYGGRSSSDVVTNMTLYNSCMEARGWSLQEQE